MNIHTVAENLRSTIAGKEALLTTLKGRRIPPESTIEFLEINIDELKKILADVERCCENATAQSWVGSVDRQGGAFEDFELCNRDGWIEP